MNNKYNVPRDFSSLTGFNSLEEYLKRKTSAHADIETYWAQVAERIDWFKSGQMSIKPIIIMRILNGLLMGSSMLLTIVLIDTLRMAWAIKQH